jgi:hypothetical protein
MADFVPPELDIIHPDTGLAFALSDEAFMRWWSSTILVEDAYEFSYLHAGTIYEARFVCALEFLMTVQQLGHNGETIIRAYCLAQNQPLDMQDALVRSNAQSLYSTPAVGFLMDCVRKRSRRIAEERIANRTTTKIEEVFERTKGLTGKERLETERLALQMGLTYLSNQSRERGAETERRSRKAVQSALERSRHAEADEQRVPGLAEVDHFLSMLVEHHGSDAIEELLRKKLPSAK